MLGKTHMTVGIAAVIAVTQPKTIAEMILAVGVGGLGAVISDIDVDTSESHREADKITALSCLAVAGVFFCDYFLHTNMIEKVIRNSGYGLMVTGILLFVAVCAFGKEQPHRSFMHSFLALFLFDFTLGIIWSKLIVYFTVGFLSHLALDLLNKKRIKLFYPYGRGAALFLCVADGIVNRLLLVAGSAALFMEMGAFVFQLFFHQN